MLQTVSKGFFCDCLLSIATPVPTLRFILEFRKNELKSKT